MDITTLAKSFLVVWWWELTFNKVVLKRRASQHHPSLGFDSSHCFQGYGGLIAKDVPLITNHKVWTCKKKKKMEKNVKMWEKMCLNDILFLISEPGFTNKDFSSFFNSSVAALGPRDRTVYILYPMIATPPSLCHRCRALIRSLGWFMADNTVTWNIYFFTLSSQKLTLKPNTH